MKKFLFLCLFVFIYPFSTSAKIVEYDIKCKEICGHQNYHYDRTGSRLNGQEKVCTYYPLECGYTCTKGWKIWTLKQSIYTCQQAIQVEGEDFTEKRRYVIEMNDAFKTRQSPSHNKIFSVRIPSYIGLFASYVSACSNTISFAYYTYNAKKIFSTKKRCNFHHSAF